MVSGRKQMVEGFLIVIGFFGFWIIVGHFWGEEDPLAQKSIYKEWSEKKERKKMGIKEKSLNDMSERDMLSYQKSLLKIAGWSDEDIAEHLGLELKNGEFFFDEGIIESESLIENDEFKNDLELEVNSNYSIGDVVKHKTYGLGIVIKFDGTGDSLRIQIKFREEVGTKWMIAEYAILEII
jgi:hypothetical protein